MCVRVGAWLTLRAAGKDLCVAYQPPRLPPLPATAFPPPQFAARSVAQHELAHSRHEASGLAVELEEARHSVAAAQAQASTAFGRIVVLEKALTAAMEVSGCSRELP